MKTADKLKSANTALKSRINELERALDTLFDECVMIQKYWGDIDNAKEATEAIAQARLTLYRMR